MSVLKAAHRRAVRNLDMIKQYPNCPVRPHAESVVAEIEATIMARGGQGKPADR